MYEADDRKMYSLYEAYATITSLVIVLRVLFENTLKICFCVRFSGLTSMLPLYLKL